jgi:hypothetical protein
MPTTAAESTDAHVPQEHEITLDQVVLFGRLSGR